MDVTIFSIKPTRGRKISQSNFDTMLGNAVNEIKYYKKINHLKSLILYLILLFLAGFYSYPQQITVQGNITDSLQNPLVYTNILVIPDSDAVDIRFATKEDNSNYKE